MRFLIRELIGIVVFAVTVGSMLIAGESLTALLRRALELLSRVS
jgi:hypothetical protein